MDFRRNCISLSLNPEATALLRTASWSCTKRYIRPYIFNLINRLCTFKAGQNARITSTSEARGHDGRGFEGPGLDHGVFLPFRIMFGEEFLDIPIVQVSIDQSLTPERNWALGKAVTKLR
jgi:hypothetical protein